MHRRKTIGEIIFLILVWGLLIFLMFRQAHQISPEDKKDLLFRDEPVYNRV